MSTLKSTIKLESTDLFPSPISFTVINNNPINGDFSSFNTITVGATAQQLNVHDLSTSVYAYFSAPTTNAVPVFIAFASATDSFLRLAPGDVAFLPIGGETVTDDIVAYTSVSTASVSYFIGNKD